MSRQIEVAVVAVIVWQIVVIRGTDCRANSTTSPLTRQSILLWIDPLFIERVLSHFLKVKKKHTLCHTLKASKIKINNLSSSQIDLKYKLKVSGT
ncbi:hypothetical protein [Streptococcus hyovaginalis]|uniref:hypothetical protein n=1 Tax=Streptococcus hyovaginalis TaxID=149015 RepID=UPI003BF87F8A